MPNTTPCPSITNRSSVPVLALLCLVGTVAVSADEGLHGSRTVCTIAADPQPRVIEVLYDNPDAPIPCKVLYEKSGAASEAGSAQNTAGVCERIERKIVGNLARAGYECQHQFLGALAQGESEPDRSIVLDLFTSDDGQTKAAPSIADADMDSDTDGDAERDAERDAGADTESESSRIAHVHRYSHAHPIGDPDGPSVEHTHTSTTEISQVSPSDSAESSGADASRARRTPVALIGSHAILSRSFDRQSDAHRFSAELKRSLPKVESRVVTAQSGEKPSDAARWQVTLGSGDDIASLEQALASLGTSVKPAFSVQPLTDDNGRPLTRDIVASDWARYALASCWADGHRSSEELAGCADVVVDVDAFVNCLGGGLCTPQRFSEGMDTNAIDFASVMGAEDPIAEARDRVTRRIEGCEHLSAVSDSEFAECAALAVLDERHRDLYDCYQRSSSELALVECAGSDKLVDYARAYERCGTSGYEATTCLLENSDNDYLESAAYCAAYEDASEIVTCGLDANLSDDNTLLLACVTDSANSTEQTLCLARERLGDDEYAAIECAGYGNSISEYGLCVAERGASVSPDTLAAARCLDGAELVPQTLLDCTGGQFVSEDIASCLDYGLEDPRCFAPDTVITQVANNAVDDYLQIAALSNEITRYREELYALDGGDIAEMIEQNGGAGIAETEKKVRKGLKGLLGF